MIFFQNILFSQYEYISFDIFDTLIVRPFLIPSDVFYCVGKNILGYRRAEEFRYRRIMAECEAREDKISKEVNLYEIYECIHGFDKELKANLMKEELNCEKKCKAKYSGLKMYKKFMEKGKKIILISDMYLPEDFIKELLEACGIRGYENLYLSNSVGCGKRSGELFKIALTKEGISKNQIIHIGDDFKSDYIGAHKAGIHACIVNRKYRILRAVKRVLISLKIKRIQKVATNLK